MNEKSAPIESPSKHMPDIIPPTVGRIVHFIPRETKASGQGAFNVIREGEAIGTGPQPCAALVTYVHDDHTVNLVIFDHSGFTHRWTSVHLVQPGEKLPADGVYCTWMAYQVGQAAKAEQLEKQLQSQGQDANTKPAPTPEVTLETSLEAAPKAADALKEKPPVSPPLDPYS